MATATYIYNFSLNSLGLADVGDDAGLNSGWIAGDGNPPGSLEWLTTTGTNPSERARDATGRTWESQYGIPVGSSVIAIQCTGWDNISWAQANITAFRTRFRYVDGSGVSIHSAGDLEDASVLGVGDGAPVHHSGGVQRAIDSAYQDSSTTVHFEGQLSLTTSGIPNIDYEWDNISLQATYTLAGAKFVASFALFPKFKLRFPDA